MGVSVVNLDLLHHTYLHRKHMKNDICPYTCIVEECPFPYRFYVTRNEWREHVLRDHPPKWRCSCCTGTRPVFQSLSSFMAHLDEKHGNQVSDANFQRIMAKSTFRPFGITSCPLCDIHGPVDSPELVEHVLGHIYDFSMYALPWRAIPQKSVKRPIRTFNDVAPVLDSNDDEVTTQMRMFNHTRLLGWAEEFHEGEEDLTPAQRATIRDLDWDDYQAMGGEDGTCPTMTDYFDRADIDYFEDDASSHRASSEAAHSTSTRRSSTASTDGHSSRTQGEFSLSAETEELTPAKTNVAHGGESAPRMTFEAMSRPGLEELEKTLETNHASGEEMLLQVLREHENSPAARHTPTLDTVKKLGILYWQQDRLEEAEEMLLRALRGYEEALGGKHTSTLDTIGSLGNVYGEQGKLEEAEEMFLRALRGYEEVLGEKHMSTLATIENLGIFYWQQHRLEEAEKMFLRALRGYEEALGEKHTSTLSTIKNLGNVYKAQGKMKEAEEMSLRAAE
jgi:tetratricopeptide (TPR) repeat protein